MVQGNILVGGVGVFFGVLKVMVNYFLVGRIFGGVMVECVVLIVLGQGFFVYFELVGIDFGIVQNVVDVINKSMGLGMVQVVDGRWIVVCVFEDMDV